MIVPYAFATPLYAEAIALRQRVLREPLGRSVVDDPLEEEWDQEHFAALDAGGGLVGTASLVKTPKGTKMRQVAVAPEAQGTGVGRALVRACERHVAATGGALIYCHARETARDFYAACGWRAEGEGFGEVGLPHILMIQELDAAALPEALPT